MSCRTLFSILRAIAVCLITATCFENKDLQADLVLHYTGDNTAADSSGNGYDANLNGASYTTAVLGSGFLFNGANQDLVGPAIPKIDPNQFSISLWLRATADNSLRLVADTSHGGVRNGNVNNEGFALQLDSSNRIDFAWGNGSTFPHVASNNIVADSQFHHIAATFDGSQMLLYIDGILDNSLAYSGTALTSGRDFRLGRHDQLGRQLFGTIDDVRVYNSVLSATQVANLAAVPEPSSGLMLGVAGVIFALRREGRCFVEENASWKKTRIVEEN